MPANKTTSKHKTIGRGAILFIVIAIFMVLLTPQPTQPINAQPELLAMVAEQPDARVNVIVQKTGASDSAAALVTQLGGEITKELALINAFAAEMRAKDVKVLAADASVNWVSLDAPVVRVSDAAVFTVRDEFNSTSYSNNDGSVNWSSDWIETNDDGSPSGGEVNVEIDDCPDPSSRCVEFDADAALNASIQRSVDLSNATTASLTFDYRIDKDDPTYLLEVSSDGGNNWTTLQTYHGETLRFDELFDLTPYMSANTTIRFLLADRGSGHFYPDNVQIAYTELAESQPPPAEEPPPGELPSSETRTIRDEFDARVYNGSNGTDDWSPYLWREIDEPNGPGPTDGPVQISPNPTYCLTPPCLRVGGTKPANPDPGFGVSRKVDLTTAATATVTFSYRRGTYGDAVPTNGTLTLDISSDGGTTWSTIKTYHYDGVDSDQTDETIDISSYLGPNMKIRFLTHGPVRDIVFFIDNFQIETTSNGANVFPRAVGANVLWHEDPRINGENVTVAIVDSGIANHADLQEDLDTIFRIVADVDFLDDDASADDFYGHGTHVAGIIAGNGKSLNMLYYGIAPQASLVDIKVIDSTGSGTISDVVAGLEWIYENKDAYNIRVVNLSLNSTIAESYHDSPLDAAVEILWFKGVVVVVSAGNNGSSAPGVLYPPANDPFVIVVGATDDVGTVAIDDDAVTSYSAYGVTVDGFAKPDLVAPGSNIVSLLASESANLALDHPEKIVSNETGSDYFSMSGTSMASAIVSGAVAQLLQDEPNLTPDQVKYRLMNSARTDWPGYNTQIAGAGYLDIYTAVHATTTESANQDTMPHMLLAKMALIAYWANTNGGEDIDWSAVDWESVNWDTVDWNSVNWGSVNWGSVNWGSVNWGSVNWGSVNWGSVNWGSVNWGSVNWGSTNTPSLDWTE